MQDFPYTFRSNEAFKTVDDASNWVKNEQDGIERTLRDHGAILFRRFPISTAQDFDTFSGVFAYDDFTYEKSFSNAVRINLTPRVFTANEAPPDTEIFLHHELAQTHHFPSKIFFCCLSAADVGGATPICRSDLLFAEFRNQHPEWTQKFIDLGLKYTIQMPNENNYESGQGRSWRSTFSVTSRTEAENRLAQLGYSWSWMEDQTLIATTPVMPAVRELPDGSVSFFNQVIAVSKGWRKREGFPAPLTFGDGLPINDDILEALTKISLRFTSALKWNSGDVALVDNFRVMHGRHAYSGETPRQIIVNLAK